MIESVWIIGGGKFGSRASDAIRKAMPDCRITVVDRKFARCQRFSEKGEDVVCSDGISFLTDLMKPRCEPEWIIPAMPIHVAYWWLRNHLEISGIRVLPAPVPEAVSHRLPHPFSGGDDVLYTTCADFICPENCPEPDDFCTVTRKPRPCTLYEELARMSCKEYLSIVIRSHQLLPGVGGYRPETLRKALEKIRENPHRTILLSTACKCHGVVNAFFTR